MLIAYPRTDEMPKTAHSQTISSVRGLSSTDVVLHVRISRRR
jgi:hypothetical protein